VMVYCRRHGMIRLRSEGPAEEAPGIHGGVVVVVEAMVVGSAAMAEGGTRYWATLRLDVVVEGIAVVVVVVVVVVAKDVPVAVRPCFGHDHGPDSRPDNAFAPTLLVEGVVCDGPISLVLVVDVVDDEDVVRVEVECTVEVFETCSSTICASSRY